MNETAVKLSFRIHEVVVLTGFSKHMLDYLARDGIFRPSQSPHDMRRGKPRLYSYADIVLLRALRTICVGQGKIRNLRAALSSLRREVGEMSHGQRIDKLLFVEGNELCLRSGAAGGHQLRSGQLTFGFFVDLRELSEDLGKIVSIDRSNGSAILSPRLAMAAEAERQRLWSPIKHRRKPQGR